MSGLEKKLKKYHRRMELIRTLVPVCVLILQIVVLVKLFNLI